jgi:cardiolipin synthase
VRAAQTDPGSGARQVQRQLRSGFAMAYALAVAGTLACGPSPGRAADAAVIDGAATDPPTPRFAAEYADNTLTLRLVGRPDAPALVASWPAEGDRADGGRREARLEFGGDDGATTQTSAGRAVSVRDPDEWDGVVRAVLAELAPSGPEQAALTVVQGQEIVVYRTPEGELRLQRHEDKPAERHVTSIVSDGELTTHAEELLHQRFPDEEYLLFQVGAGDDELSFVFFDLRRHESVLIAAPSEAQGGGIASLMHVLVRLPDTLIVRGHALGVLTRPVSSAARLAWLAAQTVATIAPPMHLASGRPPPLADQPEMDRASWERRLDGMNLPQRYFGTITPLIDGDAFFTSLVQSVQDAEHDVSVRLFIFDNDDYALSIADLLKRRSQIVRVRVLIDALGSLGAGQDAPQGGASRGQPAIAGYLRRHSKIELREPPNTWLVADHAKTLIVDRRVAYLGGMNIGQEYRNGWHDMMVMLTGPIVGRLQRDFEVAWAYAGPGGDLAYLGAIGGAESFAGPRQSPQYVELRPLYTRTLDPQVLRAQLAAIANARRAIWVEQPYVSDDALVGALIAARMRGVDVRVILPSSGDSRFMNSANLITARALARNGVRVYVYPGMTHVKAALYDGWACLGSANFDKLSTRINRETNVATSDPVFVGRLRRELFELDFARSHEMLEPPPAGWGNYIAAFVAGQL